MKNRTARVFWDSVKKNRLAILLFCVSTALNIAIFHLYGMLSEPLIYSVVITFFVMVLVILLDFFNENKKSKIRSRYIDAALSNPGEFPLPETLAESDYGEIIKLLGNEVEKTTRRMISDRQDANDYYTAWVHQIKTPIAVMKLKITEDTESNIAIRNELFRIEQYVDMALNYIRLGSEVNDLVVREYILDEIIRETVRKYAPQFIAKKLKFEFIPTGVTVVTDKKWFTCIIEQFISNAVKYTQQGEIRIYYENHKLYISDTGIGIDAEDLPRIFEKGYTGGNGRLGQKSSGLGLYICKKAANLLAINISCESKVGKGSTFVIDLQDKIMDHDFNK